VDFVAPAAEFVHDDLRTANVDEGSARQRRHDHIDSLSRIREEHAHDHAKRSRARKNKNKLAHKRKVIREALNKGDTQGRACSALVHYNCDDHLHGHAPVLLQASGNALESRMHAQGDHKHKGCAIAFFLLRRLSSKERFLSRNLLVVNSFCRILRGVYLSRCERRIGGSLLVLPLNLVLHARCKLVVRVVVVFQRVLNLRIRVLA